MPAAASSSVAPLTKPRRHRKLRHRQQHKPTCTLFCCCRFITPTVDKD
jgi:hypothetical protein